MNEYSIDYVFFINFYNEKVNVCLNILKKSNNWNAYLRYNNMFQRMLLKLSKVQQLSRYYNQDDFYPYILTILDDVRSNINDFIKNSYCKIPQSIVLDLSQYDDLIFNAFKKITLSEILFSYQKYDIL